MTDTGLQPGSTHNPAPARGLRLGAVFGIEVWLDASLLIIFALIIFLLGGNLFPHWHPAWPASTTWLTAGAAGVLFFASVLAHELAHSLVSRRFGIGVRRITLFLFGGLAEIEGEPHQPGAELLIAIAGPVTSLCIGVACLLLASMLGGAELAGLSPEETEAALSGLSPLATLLVWLGPVNIVLGLFNMVPGFPLDGGRVLRAMVWWITGDLQRATRIATDSGKVFGWCLMALGAVQAVGGAVMGGLWLVLIGWFIASSAAASYRQSILHDVLTGVTVRDLMRHRFESVPAQLRVDAFIDDYLLQSPQILWPILEDGQLIGLVTVAEVKGVAAEERGTVTLGQVMATDLRHHSLAPDTSAEQAVLQLANHGLPMAVVEHGRVIGLLSQPDVLKWIQLRRSGLA